MRMNMKRSRKSISWAPGVKLCQVKLFSSLDCPVEVGMKYQGQFKKKASSMLHSSSFEANDSPPGFEVSISMKQSKLQHFPIPQIKWQCPPKLIMSEDWCVAAGEESEEAKTQKIREMAVLEAVYPRFSAIPPSPAVSFDVECECYDHSLTPCVPINPIEEESQEDQDQEHLTPANTTVVSQLPGFSQGLLASGTENASESSPPGFEQAHTPGKLPNQSADFTAVASAALTTMMKNSEKESMIDTDLLIKILNDPKMLQKLINVQGPEANTGIASMNTLTAPNSKTVTPYVPSSLSNSDMPRTPGGNFHMPGKVGTLNAIPLQPETVQVSGLKRSAPSPPLPSFSSPQADHAILPRLPNQTQPPLSMLPQQNMAPIGSFSVQEPGTVKDMNYYKNLIRQHGTDNKEMQDPIFPKIGDNFLTDLKMSVNSNPPEMKAKNLKRCMFFKSAKGCRKGANCEYVHDMSLNWRTGMEAQSAKRMKLNGVNNKGRGMF
ncbi:PREDICTED: zinc finger CCCH domain-containing protein 6 [Fragaria vesca subsp. vesca]|uniref:zinc finger CCCH domain-containing protein 6 n=1 Tax=Fragaria vesca subsp. vesca TaxID=101020 RepID=UPI0002C315A5|nr:PREDICTED: zinc finger CCCH domain-containing protein 6 [Fragaria vesca subsp. vesca]